METVIKELRDHIAILRLNSGRANPISSKLVDELSKALVEIKGVASGLVLCGGDKFFSAGFNLPELLTLDRQAMGNFFERFNHLCMELFTVPIPTVCALSGHAVAGGNILALACDYRYAAAEDKKIGLNEVKLGLPVPYLADMMLRHIIGNRYATHMIYSGEFMTFSDAKIVGLVDVIGSADELEDFTLDRLSRIANLPNQAFSAAKANKVERIKKRYEEYYQSKNDEFLDCWFSDPAQKNLREAAAKF
ncbi:enoyl-CoA hydratase [Desulfosarcina widdelii]|uniref:Enoyl-CoA hydratase n=1 Tax=Desulfosarcina widdelii TaxID=947919 RepID=A0A5K7Z2P6_9BACT|nr:enoyl-CoA hydratase/isomerase family protein [Desulfosarcina widdelii]BBO74539.1 enoyl-CoA hydratase [Desulfosarcina widdelii]